MGDVKEALERLGTNIVRVRDFLESTGLFRNMYQLNDALACFATVEKWVEAHQCRGEAGHCDEKPTYCTSCLDAHILNAQANQDAEIARLTERFEQAKKEFTEQEKEKDGIRSDYERATAALEEEKNQTAKLREAQTCISCKSLICPPMQCGRCIETERPVEGMPERPATTNLREKVQNLTAALEEAREDARSQGERTLSLRHSVDAAMRRAVAAEQVAMGARLRAANAMSPTRETQGEGSGEADRCGGSQVIPVHDEVGFADRTCPGCVDCKPRPNPVQAFKELAELSDGHWDGVDALEYQSRVRGGVCTCGAEAGLYEACPECKKTVGGRFHPQPDPQCETCGGSKEVTLHGVTIPCTACEGKPDATADDPPPRPGP